MNNTIKKGILICGLLLVNSFLFAQVQQPNIIVIVVDDMRYDEWGGGGHSFLKTLTIDKLAKEGTQFSGAYHTV